MNAEREHRRAMRKLALELCTELLEHVETEELRAKLIEQLAVLKEMDTCIRVLEDANVLSSAPQHFNPNHH